MDDDAAQKVAFVTGGGSGIGRATAYAFARAGYAVGMADRNESAGQDTADSLRETGARAMFVRCDVASDEQVRDAVDRVAAEMGRLDVAFNAAYRREPGLRTGECTVENWTRVIGIDLTGVWHCMRHQLRHMLAGGGGAIVNCASAAGLVGAPTYGAYAAAKHGVIGLTKSAALEYARDGIRINAICPGMTDTAMTREGGKEAIFDELVSRSPLGRRGLPEEIAAAVIWLCSENASFVTGQAMAVDGGLTVG